MRKPDYLASSFDKDEVRRAISSRSAAFSAFSRATSSKARGASDALTFH